VSFPRYERYKDSGVEWLGEIPEHWTVKRLRSLARPGRYTFIDGDWIESPYITDEGIRLLQTGNIGTGAFKEQGFRFISEKTFREFSCTEVEAGNVLICRLAEPVGRACLAPDLQSRMITSVDVCILKPSESVNAQFIVYLLSSSSYLGFMERECRGGTRDRVSRSFLGSVNVPVLELTEQTTIAEFLNRETSKIDSLVEEQQRLIELLKEKRQAVISHAVTKGLNPHAPAARKLRGDWYTKPNGWEDELIRRKNIGAAYYDEESLVRFLASLGRLSRSEKE
jgi:type I restriction enzyme S subunit